MNFISVVVEVLVAGERLVAELGKAALHAERNAGTVEQDRGLETFAHQARGLQHVDETDRAFEGDGVKCNERLFAGLGFDVFKYLLLVIDEKVTLLVGGLCDGWHVALLALGPVAGRNAILQRPCQSTFCTTHHQNSQFAFNIAVNLECDF